MTIAPRVLVAELTHRCPLRCAYCSNPLALVRREAELDTDGWISVMQQAADLGVLQTHLTGGEPLLRPDLETIVAAAAGAGLYTTLVTSGVGASARRIDALVAAGVRAVQVSFQDIDAEAAARVAAVDHQRDKRRICAWVRAAGASLTVNVVLHRENLRRLSELFDLALELDADRLELAHVQFHGWAALNRRQLMPTEAQVLAAERLVGELKARHAGRLHILYVMPDHFSGRPKPCMGGWGRSAIVVSPEGRAMPCHGAASLPFALDDLRQVPLAQSWAEGEAFRAYRGDDWMESPCRECPEKGHDFGGCRCQAWAYLGRATATDPACSRSPEHQRLVAIRRLAEPHEPRQSLIWRDRRGQASPA